MLFACLLAADGTSWSTYRRIVQVDSCSAGVVVLHERPDEAQPEGSFEQELGFPLVLRQAKEGHVAQVLLGRLQEELGPLLLWNRGHVVAADEAQVRQHAHLQTEEQEVKEGADMLLSTEADYLKWLVDFFGSRIQWICG